MIITFVKGCEIICNLASDQYIRVSSFLLLNLEYIQNMSVLRNTGQQRRMN